MNRQDWTLLAVSASKGEGLSPVQLQKTLFLLGKHLSAAELGPSYYEFEPYNYGPFDVSIYQDAEALSGKGLIAITRAAERSWPMYQPTGLGTSTASKLRAEVSPHAIQYLDQVISWVQRLSFRDLVRAIYAEYPEYRANSVFRD